MGKSTKKIKQSIAESYIDGNGEIQEVNKKVQFQYEKEPAYVKLYIADLMLLNGLPKSHTTVLYGLFKYMRYADEENGQVVVVSSYIKNQIVKNNPNEIQNVQTVSNAISNLKRKGILIEVGRAAYLINPNVIGKGDWRDISELRMTLTYNSNGREMTTSTTKRKKTEIIDFKKKEQEREKEKKE